MKGETMKNLAEEMSDAVFAFFHVGRESKSNQAIF